MNMNGLPHPVPRKPKIEKTSGAGEEKRSNNGGNHEEEDDEETTRKEQEEAPIALIEHRTKEVERLRHRITYYPTQLFLQAVFRVSQPAVKTKESGSKVAISSSGSQQKAITPTNDNTDVKVMEDRSYRLSPEPEE